MIKDSGDRTRFDTGAVRDMRTGKGRMDLAPWYAIIELSKHCEEGALKYGERNADLGIPLHSLLDSGARHLAKYIAGERDEDHLRAAVWNMAWALQQRTTHPELDDMPWARGCPTGHPGPAGVCAPKPCYGYGQDNPGPKGPVGYCPGWRRSWTTWDPETDTNRCRRCGWTDAEKEDNHENH